jgi:hypothetical protein
MTDIFIPLTAGYSMSVTDSSGTTTGALDPSTKQVVLHNDGSNTVFVNWGRSATEATCTVANAGWKITLPANSEATFTTFGSTFIAAICSTGLTTTLRVMQGVGP